jgi:hypothetical protein
MLASTLSALFRQFFRVIAIYLLKQRKPPVAPSFHTMNCVVTLQQPLNEQHVVDRLIDAKGALDYPATSSAASWTLHRRETIVPRKVDSGARGV